MIKRTKEAQTIWQILSIADVLKKFGEKICAEEGVTTQQWLILLYLAKDPNIPFYDEIDFSEELMASELADAFHVSRPNITNMLHALHNKGLIEQIEDERDRRKKRLRLTARGKQVINNLEPGRAVFNKRLFADINPMAASAFLEYLKTVHATLVAHYEAYQENASLRSQSSPSPTSSKSLQ